MTSADEALPPRHNPFAALRKPDFRLFLVARTFSATANTLLQAVMAWQVYEVSGSTLSLGILGLVRFVPALGIRLIGGAVADTFNRKTIIMATQAVPLACAAFLAFATFGDWVSLSLIYALVLVVALASAFENPAGTALLPALVASDLFPSAVSVHSSVRTLGSVAGPALSGAIIATAGVGAAYSVHVGFLLGSLVSLASMRYQATRRAARLG